MRATDISFLCNHIVRYEGQWPLLPFLPRDLENASDEELLKLIKQGIESQRRDAFSAIYDRYALDVWRFIRSEVSKSAGAYNADAKDIFGDVWEIALDDLDQFEWRGIPIKVWLIRTARNKCRETYREIQTKNEHRTPFTEIHEETLTLVTTALQLDEDSSPPTPPAEIRKEVDKLLHQALSKLSKRQREIIILIYFKQVKTSKEIGQLLGMNPVTVRVYHKRALSNLQKHLRSSYPPPPVGGEENDE